MAKILVVDDLAMNRALLVTLLGYQGHELIEASDGADALAHVRIEHPALVISDILMPTMDGFEFVRQLRADPLVAATPVIFYTAHYHQREALSLAESCGVARVLLKPCEPEAIIRCVNEVLGDELPGVADRPPSDFDRDHVRLITDQLSRESGELVSANARLAALNELNVKLASERDMPTLLRAVCTAARELFGAKYAVLWAKSTIAATGHVFATSGIGASYQIAMPDGDVGPLGEVLDLGTSVRFADLRGNAGAIGLPLTYPPAYAALAAPLTSPTGVFGWICLVDKLGAAEFTAEDERALTILAAQAGRIYETGGLLVQVNLYTEELLLEMAEREHAVALMHESERRFSDMLGNVHLISVMLDTEARITYCNDFLLYLTGWSRRELLGRNWFEVFVPPESTEWKSIWTALLHGNPIASHHEAELLTRSGERRQVRWSNSLLQSSAGEATGTASIGEDITDHKLSLANLSASEQRFRQLAENIDDVFYITSPDFSKMEYLSPAYERIWARRRVGAYEDAQAWTDAIHPDDRMRVLADFKIHLVNRLPGDAQFRIVRPDGGIRWVHSRTFVVLDPHGDAVRLVGTATDITERKSAQEKVEKLDRVLALLSAIDALIVRAEDRIALVQAACLVAVDQGRFQYACIAMLDAAVGEVSATQRRSGSGEEQPFILPPFDFADPQDSLVSLAMSSQQAVICNDLLADHRPILHRHAMLGRGYRSCVALPLIVGGRSSGCLVLVTGETDFFTDTEIPVLLALSADISFALDHIDKADRLSYLAHYDGMTGLANRTLFAERLAQFASSTERAAGRIALVVAGTRRFESINESFGRLVGDQVLKQLAERLCICIGNPIAAARVGSDHFAAVIPGVGDDADLTRRIDLLRTQWLGEPFRVNGNELHLSARFGIAVFPQDAADTETLLQNAESALRRAKATDVAELFYTARMGDRIANELALELKLRRALVNGEFLLHYQPKVDLRSGEITGLEALIRWQSPELGLVPPIEFIPLLEDTGIIVDVGAWVMRRAMQDRIGWLKQGIAAPRVAVNVSAVQLVAPDFVETVNRILLAGGEDAGIDFEVTESVIIKDVAYNIGKLRAMRDLGVRIAIDDFGTGYSSLSYLAKLPVELLKIDRSFTSAMLDDPDAAALTLVSAIISLAHSLKLTVIAEGVESEEQAKILRVLHCDQMQGYLVCPPLSFAPMADYLHACGTQASMAS